MPLDFDSAPAQPQYTPGTREWRTQLRRFIDTEIMPHAEDWDEAGQHPHRTVAQGRGGGLLGWGIRKSLVASARVSMSGTAGLPTRSWRASGPAGSTPA